MRFNNCVFDFYGTLADIRTDEEKPELWEEMAELYASRGAVWKWLRLPRTILWRA